MIWWWLGFCALGFGLLAVFVYAVTRVRALYRMNVELRDQVAKLPQAVHEYADELRRRQDEYENEEQRLTQELARREGRHLRVIGPLVVAPLAIGRGIRRHPLVATLVVMGAAGLALLLAGRDGDRPSEQATPAPTTTTTAPAAATTRPPEPPPEPAVPVQSAPPTSTIGRTTPTAAGPPTSATGGGGRPQPATPTPATTTTTTTTPPDPSPTPAKRLACVDVHLLAIHADLCL